MCQHAVEFMSLELLRRDVLDKWQPKRQSVNQKNVLVWN